MIADDRAQWNCGDFFTLGNRIIPEQFNVNRIESNILRAFTKMSRVWFPGVGLTAGGRADISERNDRLLVRTFRVTVAKEFSLHSIGSGSLTKAVDDQNKNNQNNSTASCNRDDHISRPEIKKFRIRTRRFSLRWAGHRSVQSSAERRWNGGEWGDVRLRENRKWRDRRSTRSINELSLKLSSQLRRSERLTDCWKNWQLNRSSDQLEKAAINTGKRKKERSS